MSVDFIVLKCVKFMKYYENVSRILIYRIIINMTLKYVMC